MSWPNKKINKEWSLTVPLLGDRDLALEIGVRWEGLSVSICRLSINSPVFSPVSHILCHMWWCPILSFSGIQLGRSASSHLHPSVRTPESGAPNLLPFYGLLHPTGETTHLDRDFFFPDVTEPMNARARTQTHSRIPKPRSLRSPQHPSNCMVKV